MSSLVKTEMWQKLCKHYEEIKDTHMKDMFASDDNRFSKYSVRFNDILLDYSKNRINDETMPLLIELANTVDLKGWIEKMFSGSEINSTEKRSVLHTALRNRSNAAVRDSSGMDVIPKINAVKAQMRRFVDEIHSGKWKGATGKSITDIVNIGIGGSHLGPQMVSEALKHLKHPDINVYFVSNVDGTDITETLSKLNPENTLFIIASKSFTTQETLTNANTAKKWFLKDGFHSVEEISRHFVALSTNESACKEFGIDPRNMFGFWDWVGGRYSLWSAIGLSVALQIGMDNFEELLHGAYDMDTHFRTTPFERNLPVILALLGVWYNNFFNAESYAVIPYDQYLLHFPDYLQQLDMESNGKTITRDLKKVEYSTGPVIWGTIGTNSQHSFFQLIHQGTKLIPADFLAPVENVNKIGEHHEILLSNFFAQTEALMKGKTKKEVEKELEDKDLSKDELETLLANKVFPGNKPTNSIMYRKLTPYILGLLIAMYEHKVFVQGVLWNINSFDQWGVELGKQLAKKILPQLSSDKKIKNHDSSTNGLINYYKDNKGY